MSLLTNREQVGFRPGQVVLVPHNGKQQRVQIRTVKVDAIATWLIYFVDCVPYRCLAAVAVPVF